MMHLDLTSIFSTLYVCGILIFFVGVIFLIFLTKKENNAPYTTHVNFYLFIEKQINVYFDNVFQKLYADISVIFYELQSLGNSFAECFNNNKSSKIFCINLAITKNDKSAFKISRLVQNGCYSFSFTHI